MITVMLAVTTAMALLSLYLCYSFISGARQLRAIQTQVAIMNNNRQMINVLAAEALEYSKKNPAIDPIFTQKISLDPYDQNQPHPVLQFLAPPRIFLYQEVGYL